MEGAEQRKGEGIRVFVSLVCHAARDGMRRKSETCAEEVPKERRKERGMGKICESMRWSGHSCQSGSPSRFWVGSSCCQCLGADCGHVRVCRTDRTTPNVAQTEVGLHSPPREDLTPNCRSNRRRCRSWELPYPISPTHCICVRSTQNDLRASRPSLSLFAGSKKLNGRQQQFV